MRKELILIVCLFILLSGCATYNANKDPVYQSYLRGEITYDTYVEHFNNLMSQRIATINALQQLNRDTNQAIQQRYENSKSTHTDCYQIGNSWHCDSKRY